MDIKERNRIIGVITFFIGLIIIVFLIPIFISFSNFSLSYVLRYLFISYSGYLYLDLLVLAITLFFYSFFMLRTIKTLKGRKNLAIVAMSVGVVLVVFPLIGIGFLLPGFLYFLLDGFMYINFMFALIPLLALLIPGIVLFIHGWYMRKNLRIETKS